MTPARRFLLAPVGTEGDVRPMAALGKALVEKGHVAVLAASAGFDLLARSAGLQFVEMGMDSRRFILANPDMMKGNPLSTLRPMIRVFSDFLREQVDGLLCLAGEFDVVVASGLMFGAGSVAERLGITHRHVVHMPQVLPSAHHPPMLIPAQRLPHAINRLLWTVSSSLLSLTLGPSFNRERRRLGLAPVRSLQSVLTSGVIVAMDDALAPVPPDVSAQYDSTAYWPLEGDDLIGPELDSFLKGGDPPVYIGFGSMAHGNPAATLAMIRGAVESAGVRAVVAGGWAGLEAAHDGSSLHVVERVPHRALLPRTAAAIHHGGAGTTWTVARAGIPQAALPHMLDQFYWAERIRRIGIGPGGIPLNKVTQKHLAALITDLVGNRQYREPATALSKRLASRDGLEEAVRIFGSL